MNWFFFLLVGAGCGFVSAGLVRGKRGSELLGEMASGAVTALLVWFILSFVFKVLFGLLPLVLAILVAMVVLALLGGGKKG